MKKNLKGRGDFLFEIGCEEIPAGMIVKACGELKALLEKYLLANALLDAGSRGEIPLKFSVRRVGWWRLSQSVRLRQEDVMREIIGPPKSVAFDDVGEPTRAAMSFAEKQGVPVSKLSIVITPKGEYLAVKQEVDRASRRRRFLQKFCRKRFRKFAGRVRCIGPALSRPALHPPDSLDRRAARWQGCAVFVCRGARRESHTKGIDFSGAETFAVNGPQDYEPKLKKNFVLCRPEARQQKIEAEIAASHREANGCRCTKTRGLLELVTYLNEYPTVIIGDFDPAYLALPEEILITVMRGHQKYFGLETEGRGTGAAFSGGDQSAERPEGVGARGTRARVARAVCRCAVFLGDGPEDRLGDYLPKLKAVTYESRLGSYGDKGRADAGAGALARGALVQRAAMSQADVAGSDRAAELAKCDLVTEMVREFPELQGVVGGLYARAQGEPEEIAWAVYDQYKPRGLGRSVAAQPDRMRGGAGRQAGFAGGMFCRGRGADGLKRSIRFASRGAGDREDYSRAESAAFAFRGDFRGGQSAEGTCAEDRGDRGGAEAGS